MRNALQSWHDMVAQVVCDHPAPRFPRRICRKYLDRPHRAPEHDAPLALVHEPVPTSDGTDAELEGSGAPSSIAGRAPTSCDDRASSGTKGTGNVELGTTDVLTAAAFREKAVAAIASARTEGERAPVHRVRPGVRLPSGAPLETVHAQPTAA